MRLETALSKLGLTGNKSRVYLAILEVGSGSIQDIALVAKLPRTTTHEIVRDLISLGLVSLSSNGKRSLYNAESPTALSGVIHEKERLIKSIIPELNSLLNKGSAPKVRYYDGKAGVHAVFEDTLTVSKPLLRGILSIGNLYNLMGHDFMDAYVPRRVSAGIHLRVIRSHSTDVIGARGELWPTSKEQLRELRYTPPSMHFALTTYIYDNKVCLVGTEKEPFGMIIESEEFYKTQEQLFELLWQASTPA